MAFIGGAHVYSLGLDSNEASTRISVRTVKCLGHHGVHNFARRRTSQEKRNAEKTYGAGGVEYRRSLETKIVLLPLQG